MHLFFTFDFPVLVLCAISEPEEVHVTVLQHEMGRKPALVTGLGGPILSAAMAMMQQGWLQWRSSG